MGSQSGFYSPVTNTFVLTVLTDCACAVHVHVYVQETMD